MGILCQKWQESYTWLNREKETDVKNNKHLNNNANQKQKEGPEIIIMIMILNNSAKQSVN